MKKLYLFMVCLWLLGSGTCVLGQPSGLPVRFSKGNFITGSNITKQQFKKEGLEPARFDGRYYVLLQFSELPGQATRQQMRSAGIELNEYLPGNAYLACIREDADLSSLSNYGISSLNIVPSFYKIDPSLATNRFSTQKENAKTAAVSISPQADVTRVKETLQKMGAVIVPSKFNKANFILIQPDTGIIGSVAALPFVEYIGLQSVSDKALNYKSGQLHGLSALWAPGGRNLSGKNVTVGVGDNAEITTHLDFTGRVINRVFSVPSFHGIHTSGTVAGAGLLDPRYHGMAPRATIVSQWFSDVVTNTPVYVADYNMIATNNSYTSADDGCPGEGIYDALSNYTDAQMKAYESVLHVFSAGNDGTYTCTPYPSGYGTVKTGWQCAKNVITVGAIDQVYDTITFFSSRGPVQDGRLKPEIVASGYNVISTRQNNTYGTNSGTSMSGPMVAGAITVMDQRYQQLHASMPKASLIKALLCNTAEDLGNPGLDYTYGFGMMNARRAVEAMEANRYFIGSTAPASYSITVPAGARRLKVMLYWADPAAAPNAASTLVNDLDLTVTDPSSVIRLPLVLNPNNVTAVAQPGADHTNNIEQVVIDNPVAGNYALNVNAYSVPQGPQEYILTYQYDMNGITVEYPFGGEMIVPGEVETIRWSAYGNESNTLSVDYSTDNGATWSSVSNSVPAEAMSLNWTVPTTITNTALIRVSRNGTAYTDQSDYPFVVLGQPVLTASVPCEGYAQLSWSAVAGATSYDVLQQLGDSMAVIGNTTSLGYLVGGLNSGTASWFGVAAKNGTASGRRSISVKVIPSTGTCSLGSDDNDFKAVSVDAPVSGRQFTSRILTSSEPVKFTVKNLDDVASTGSYDLSYQVNGSTPVTETSGISIPSLGTYQYTFAQQADLSATGTYTIRAWVKHTGDTQPLNDTVTVTVKNLSNPPLTLPVSDGFETTASAGYTTSTLGLDGDDRLDFSANSSRGRVRTFVNTGFALNGNRALTLDQFPYGGLNTDSLLMTFNIAGYNAGNQLRFDFNYKNHGQANNPDNKIWVRGSDSNTWVPVYDLVANQADLGQWKHGSININDALGTAVPPQSVSTSFQVKIGEQGNTSANDPYPVLDQDDGYTFDDVTLAEALNDVAITQVISPVSSGCAMDGVHPVSISIKNYSATAFTNVPVYYRINGGTPVSELIPAIAPNATQTFTFATNANLVLDTDYSFDIWLSAPGDNYRTNDSVINYHFHTSPMISSFPYLEGFENNSGYWYPKGTNSSWQWGTPAKTLINKAANGSKAWVTSLTGNYNNNELSYLYSPCFDLSGLTQPVLSFSHIYSIEDDCPCDYTWVDYSADGGQTWNRLGTNTTGVNWYNDPTGLYQWRTSQPKWHVASIDIPTHSANVKFRIAMSSDGGFNTEGVAVDDIHIFDKAPVYTGPQLLNTTQPVSGSNWVHFTSGSTRFASINPNGQDMGNTTVDVYPFSGTVRNSNNQYYLNRNIVVRPAIQPSSPVSVRFYFTDSEAKNLVVATGCSLCSAPGDPYELGVTKFSGTPAQENGSLADDLPWSNFLFILPANTDIIPYDNGYYAEFSVNSFSEFWLNNGGPGGNAALPLTLVDFEAVKQVKKVLLQWSTENEVNTDRFLVERSGNGIDYLPIGQVTALNRTGTGYYNYTDAHPFAGLNFYRLKLLNRDASFQYSPVRKVDFAGADDDITLYPNPVTDSKLTIASTANCTAAVLYDAAGKRVRDYLLRGRINSLSTEGMAPGFYQLKIFTERTVQTQKVLIR